MGMFLKETGDLVSSCEAVHVYTDQTTMKPTPITDELKVKLKFN
jgi:acyl-CoA thioesterase FadM